MLVNIIYVIYLMFELFGINFVQPYNVLTFMWAFVHSVPYMGHIFKHQYLANVSIVFKNNCELHIHMSLGTRVESMIKI